MIETKAQQMVVEQDQGESVASIAERHGVSEQRVYAVRRLVGGSGILPPPAAGRPRPSLFVSDAGPLLRPWMPDDDRGP